MLEQNLITIDQIRSQNYSIEGLNIKSYLPLPIKQLMIKNILKICTIEEESSSLKKINFSSKEFAYEFTMISQYSDLNCDIESVVNLYDELKESQVIEAIFKQIPQSEIDFIKNILDEEIKQIQIVDNSIQSIIGKVLNKLETKIPDNKTLIKLIKDLPKQINKISPEKLSYLSSAIGWNNGEKKD